MCCGALEHYDKLYDRVNVKNERPLKRIDRIFHTVTTTDDPVIRKLARSEPDANVFATDAILATLMCCTRSVYSWDIVVQKIGGKVFLDKRDNTEFGKSIARSFCFRNLEIWCLSRSYDQLLVHPIVEPQDYTIIPDFPVVKSIFNRCFAKWRKYSLSDLLTVGETSSEPPQDEGSSLNSPRNLALEATFINHNFSQQVLKPDEKFKFEEDNPFLADEEEGEVWSFDASPTLCLCRAILYVAETA